MAKELDPELIIDGEFQFDAAFVPSVAKRKHLIHHLKDKQMYLFSQALKQVTLAIKLLNVLVDFEAIGPILQGLNKPVNDLSRGCNEEDVYKLGINHSSQALVIKKTPS